MCPWFYGRILYEKLKEEENENEFSLYMQVLGYFSMWVLTKIDRGFTVVSSMGGYEKQRKAFSRIGRQERVR